MKSISPTELAGLMQKGPIELVDVRTPLEFREVHVDFARNVPLDRLDPKQVMADRKENEEAPLYLICKSGSRGQMACDKFRKVGFENVINVEGGTSACEDAGFTMIRGKKAVSLERQVRIAAGILIVLGVALGFLVHPGFHLLAGFVGAGLTFAGITDTCAMGMLIAKMPWNQVSNTCEVDTAAISEGNAG